jgi:hypothetical protein
MQMFAVDMFISFVTPFQDEGRVWVSDPGRIALHYVKTWFLVDLISIFPFEVIALFSDTKCVLGISRFYFLSPLLKSVLHVTCMKFPIPAAIEYQSEMLRAANWLL